MSIEIPTSSSLSSRDNHPIIEVSRKRVVIIFTQCIIFFSKKAFQSIGCNSEMGSHVLYLSRDGTCKYRYMTRSHQ